MQRSFGNDSEKVEGRGTCCVYYKVECQGKADTFFGRQKAWKVAVISTLIFLPCLTVRQVQASSIRLLTKRRQSSQAALPGGNTSQRGRERPREGADEVGACCEGSPTLRSGQGGPSSQGLSSPYVSQAAPWICTREAAGTMTCCQHKWDRKPLGGDD